MNTLNNKIFLAGHMGMLGRAVHKVLKVNGFSNILVATRNELDLRSQTNVAAFFKKTKPDIVINTAAKAGGIQANKESPYTFLMDNLKIQNNLIDSSLETGVKKFIFVASASVYPHNAKLPINEDALMSGPLESNLQWYALAKIAGIKACEAIYQQYKNEFISVIPCNLYGAHDKFDAPSAHVLPALIHKFHHAKLKNVKSIELWGTGTPQREFLHVNELAEAIVLLMEKCVDHPLINIGSGREVSIMDLALMIKSIVGFKGEIFWNNNMPDGAKRKLLDSSKIHLMGWKSNIALHTGITEVYKWYLNNEKLKKQL